MSKRVDGGSQEEAPLIGTVRFVFVMGATFAVLWLALYLLLWERW